jgi:hypothetical protein
MKILPMYENRPHVPDLVFHTAKHFFDASEGRSWDRVPAGTMTAEAARNALGDESTRPPPTGAVVDVRWWWPPWLGHARKAHEQGYCPRYMLLLELAGDPAGPRWEPAACARRLAEYAGFRLIVEPRGDDFQVVTAFFSPLFNGSANLPKLAPALRAFAARRSCPPEGVSGVSPGETK